LKKVLNILVSPALSVVFSGEVGVGKEELTEVEPGEEEVTGDVSGEETDMSDPRLICGGCTS
jgi:hypothetical protein